MYSVRIDPKLADYFLEAKSPSIYVWYYDERRKAFWSEVHHSNLTPKKHRIQIPKKQSLGLHSSGDLLDITRRWWGIEDNLPRLECITIPRVRVSDVKQSARDFYDEWRNEHFVSSAFGHVNITLKGWRHLTMASRPQQQIVRRLALLGYAREILKSIPIYHVCRRDEERGVSYCMQTAMVIEKTRANAVVSVITEVPDKGLPTFYSVFEHRSRGGSGEPVPRGLLGATAR